MGHAATSTAEPAFGGFALAGMGLALPIEVLREVVPAQAWLPLPCDLPAVVGGLELRGVVVPVLDLRTCLGRHEPPPPAQPCVLIVVYAGELIGLLEATVRRRDTGEPVNVLSLPHLATQPGLPRVADPEPERQHVDAAAMEEAEVEDDSLTMVLLQCGDLPLALDALAVHATVAQPVVQPSPLARGACKGTIEHGGTRVPAVDVHALCGLGPLAADQMQQAFVVAWPAGLVAFLVTEVVDVVRLPQQALLPVPAFALPQAALMHRAVPIDALPEALRQRLGARERAFLMLERDRLMACEELCNLAEANAKADGMSDDASSFVRGVQGAGDQRAMLTYALSQETATPLAQVDEILPLSRSQSSFDTSGPLMGYATHRGHAIPVLDLARLTGLPSAPMGDAASVLVVASEGELVGFAVPQLKSLEPSSWLPEVPQMGAQMQASGRRQLAQVGLGDQVRMLPVVDLLGLAAQLRSRAVMAL